jgi:dTDP-4-dehydrorhamnose 3,5-epimerase
VKFLETPLESVFVIQLEPVDDERGSFARVWCRDEFEANGLATNLAQANASFNRRRGTLRGLHYQVAPREETKVVRCTRGALWDVAVDLRPDSPTYLKWFGLELTPDNGTMLYVPRGCAHGYVTLVDATEAFYLTSAPYASELERGVRWDDPVFSIEWPVEPLMISDKDASWPSFLAV